jgi:hypothetical protein
MNVFEDLIVELQEENLLEETVALRPKTNGNSHKNGSANGNGNGNGHYDNLVTFESVSPSTPKYRAPLKPEAVKTNLADQMSGLQFVEFVISAAERLQGSAGRPFDDLQVQKDFHYYSQAGSDTQTNEYFEAESALIDSLRKWEEDLLRRDQAVPADMIRGCAESANPPLSPQALFALVRFYRSVPVSENSYLKFDFVVTRLFSKFIDGERRDMLCSRSDVVKHLNQRYSVWGMNTFKSLPGDDPDVALVCLSFDDFAAEANNASRLSELIVSNFFQRLYEFKLSTGAMMFVPQITAAAIESNLKISRKMFDLLSGEADRGGLGRLSGVDNMLVSNAIARTFEVASSGDPIQHDESDRSPAKAKAKRSARPPATVKAKASSGSRFGANLFGVNRWLLLATILSVVASVGIYVWSEYSTSEPASTSLVKSVDLQVPELAQYIKTAKVSGDILYAVVTPKFLELGQDKRRDIVQQVRQLGDTKGYKRVNFYDLQGKTVAYGSADRIDIH